MSDRSKRASSVCRGLRVALLPLVVGAGLIGCGVKGNGPGSDTAGTTGSAGATATAGTTGTGTAGATDTAGTTGTAGTTATAGASGGGNTGTAGTVSTGGTTGTAGAGGTTGTAGVTGTAGSTALSGITVAIGGTEVPKENVVAFINFGHSNMAGRGVSPANLRPYFFTDVQAKSWMYHSGPGFQPSLEPKTAGDSGNNVNGMVSGGLSTALVKQAAAMNPGKYFVTVPFGAGKAYCSQFCPAGNGPCSGGTYYNNVIKGAKEIKDKVTWGGIVIYLGITERHGTQMDIDNYPQCINKLVTSIRTDLGQPNLPLLINDYEMGSTGPLAPTSAFALAIRPKILMVPTVVSNSVVIPTDNPLIPIEDIIADRPDLHHFTLLGQQMYADRALQTMKDKGWAPWLTP